MTRPIKSVILFQGDFALAVAAPVLRDAQAYIPAGPYCYATSRTVGQCPFWQLRDDKLEQEQGYCHFLSRGDWQEGLSLLWDQVKECGIGDDWVPDDWEPTPPEG